MQELNFAALTTKQAPGWLVGARLTWIEGGFEEGDICGTVYEVDSIGEHIRIKWDDGEVDAEWWAVADEDLTLLRSK